LPASAAQVFGPTTVDPGFDSGGEKTLLTMNTTLPAGGKNVIIVSFVKTNIGVYALGTYRIYKGSTLLFESSQPESFNQGSMRAKHVLLVAVDSTPSGNDSYSFRINITTSGTATGSVHVQGIVIKTDDASWAYNTSAVSINPGDTATVTSMSTTFPANSKVVLVAIARGNWLGYGNELIGAGNIKLKAGTTVVSSSQFNIGTLQFVEPLWVSLTYLDTPSSGSQTYSVEVSNGNAIYIFDFYAELVAFTVFDGFFLDTTSVTLTNATQVTVGNLTTSLSGDVVVMGLAAAENTGGAQVTAFNANDVVLQLNNSATGQIGNLVGWLLEATNATGRSGVLSLFRIDTGVTNPSYQIKMTARAAGINGEAKILAFSLSAGLDIKKVFGETVWETESSIIGRRRFRDLAELVNLNEFERTLKNLVRLSFEVENVSETFRGLRSRVREFLERLNISESMSRSLFLFRVAVENVLLSEVILRIRSMVKMVLEVVRSLEAIVRSRIVARLMGEGMHIFEVFNSVKGSVKAITESFQISESFQRVRGLARIVAEQVGMSELISKTVKFVKIFVENINLSEVFKAMRSRFLSMGESLGISEIAVRFKGAVKVLGEAINLGEFSRGLRNRFSQISEVINIGEAFAGLRFMARAVLEVISILESWLVSRVVARFVSEAIAIGESLVRFKGWVLAIVERVNITESRLFKIIKRYIDRLVSTLRGVVVGGEV
jgi:hypothetical protein